MLSMESEWTVFKRRPRQETATGVIVDKKHNPAPKAQTQADGRKPSKGFGPKKTTSFLKERPECVQKFPQRIVHESVV